MTRRMGVSITELLVVMGVSTVALMASVTMLRQVMVQQRNVSRSCAVHDVARRLTTQFRQDIHAASSVDLSVLQAVSTLRLVQPNHVVISDDGPVVRELEVVYEAKQGRLSRTQRVLSNAASEERLAELMAPGRERYRFGDPYRISLRELDDPGRVVLQVTRSRRPLSVRNVRDAADASTGRIETPCVQIEARVGRHVLANRIDQSVEGGG